MNPFELLKVIGERTPIDPGRIAELTAGVRTRIVGNDPDTWMSPHQPLEPQEMQVKGRQWDFPVGVNLQYTPRGTEPITFAQLRALADGYDILRIIIETRKDQLTRYKWNIVPLEPEKKADQRCKDIEKFLRRPNKVNNWQTWLRALLEDMLVIDAACIYPRMTRGGKMHSLDLMDGSTLKIVIDESGRQPEPPGVAYQQVLKGIPAVDYSADELVYAPRNVRTNRLYGYSPVEQVIMTVNIAMRRQLSQLQAYTEGNVPEAIASVPATWNADQIAKFQAYWDSLLEGNTAMRRHMKFVPDGMKYYPTIQEMLKDPFDEWLARVICFCFSISPSAFVRDMNRATAQTAQASALEEGLMPLMSWIKDTLDLIIERYFGYDDLQFSWKDEEPPDPTVAAAVNETYIRMGVKSVDEVRERLGLDPIGMPHAIFGNSATLIKDVLNPPQPQMIPGMGGEPGGGGPPNPFAGKPKQAESVVAKPPKTGEQPTEPGSERSKPTEPEERGATSAAGKTDVNVTMPPINITMPPVRAPDVMVDIGPTKIEMPTAAPQQQGGRLRGPRKIVAKRNADGTLTATITEEVEQHITAKRNQDGSLTATIIDKIEQPEQASTP